jgi:hypothetical protein
MAELNASELAELVDPEAIAHIIFNQNRSLSGPQLDDANAAVGRVVLNLLAHGEPAGNGCLTAPIGLPERMSDNERNVILEQARRAAKRVIEQRSRGIDPTGGAREYNHRPINPAWTKERAHEYLWRKRQTTGSSAKLSFGPFLNSKPTPLLPRGHSVYLVVYGKSAANKRNKTLPQASQN